jgi:hypothetical protein
VNLHQPRTQGIIGHNVLEVMDLLVGKQMTNIALELLPVALTD